MNHATTTAAEIRLMDEAVAATGLSDFGEHDDFRIGLRVLMAAADERRARTARRARRARRELCRLPRHIACSWCGFDPTGRRSPPNGSKAPSR